jgi:LPXTG-site transpeptidase (sortase) family protein
VRVHAPAGARLLGAEGFDAPPTAVDDCGRASFGAPLTIMAGTTSRVTLTYALPARVVQGGAYDLVVQHQPGVPPGTVSLRVGEAAAEATAARGEHLHWRLPPGGQLEPAPLPAPSGRDCGRAVVKADPIAAPGGLEIPSIGVDAPVVPLGIDKDGLMQEPTSPDVVGWYGGSARAGQPGNSVMSGHVDWRQRTAVFWDLRKLQAGDEIRVRGQDGRLHTYTVDWNRAFPVEQVPKREVLEGTDDATLTLITCDGQFDPIARDYSHRRAVRASIKSDTKKPGG